MTPQQTLDFSAPDITDRVTEDDTPVDNFQSENQQRLLVEPLYSSWSPTRSVSFWCDARQMPKLFA